MRLRFAALALLVVGCPAHRPARAPPPADSDAAAMQRVLAVARGIFRDRYAPLELKAAELGFHPEDDFERLDVAVENDVTPAAFRVQLRELFRSPRDLHTSLQLSDPRAVWLGFHLKRAGGRVRVAWVDRTVLPADVFPFEPGDEVVSFDQNPIDEELARTARLAVTQTTPAFTASFAEWFLTLRAATEWASLPAPGARAQLELRHGAAAPKRYFQRLLDQPRDPRLTAPVPMIGERVEPLPEPLYAGPVVMAIDELNISAAEFVAAALRDGGRVKLFGVTTAGAGGDQRTLSAAHVCGPGERDDSRPLFNCVSPALAADLKRLGIASLSYTVSLGVRTDGSLIENRGVAPDIGYLLTEEDLRSGFGPMRARLVEVLGRP